MSELNLEVEDSVNVSAGLTSETSVEGSFSSGAEFTNLRKNVQDSKTQVMSTTAICLA